MRRGKDQQKKQTVQHLILPGVMLSLFIGIAVFALLPATALAAVTGNCANCHTMHNSQDNTALVTAPENYLLNTGCAGCHSSSTTDTIVNFNGSLIPIVFNTTGYPAKPLAGGNFYHVSLGGAANDAFGHNVWGISGVDTNITESEGAPGGTASCGVGSGSCHNSLATDPATNNTFANPGTGGCEGCHLEVKHHGAEPPAGQPATAESGWYRGLGGHFNLRVTGIESPDWEQNPTPGSHNVYSGRSDHYALFNFSQTIHSITAFCVGCHETIHYDGGGPSPWIRHPSDKLLLETGEYAAYDPVSNYDPTVPVGWLNLTAPSRSEAVVICLSCHRAHGSQYPDMLRWDYAGMLAHTTDADTGQGCFVCHSTKDAP